MPGAAGAAAWSAVGTGDSEQPARIARPAKIAGTCGGQRFIVIDIVPVTGGWSLDATAADLVAGLFLIFLACLAARHGFEALQLFHVFEPAQDSRVRLEIYFTLINYPDIGIHCDVGDSRVIGG